jgi:hypothetical protein
MKEIQETLLHNTLQRGQGDRSRSRTICSGSRGGSSSKKEAKTCNREVVSSSRKRGLSRRVQEKMRWHTGNVMMRGERYNFGRVVSLGSAGTKGQKYSLSSSGIIFYNDWSWTKDGTFLDLLVVRLLRWFLTKTGTEGQGRERALGRRGEGRGWEWQEEGQTLNE